MKLNKIQVLRIYAVIIGGIALILGGLAWFDSLRFTQEAGIAVTGSDFGTMMAVKFIGNRNVSTGILLFSLYFFKKK